MSRTIALVVVVILVGGLSAAASGPNLVRNPDFTLGVKGNGVPVRWSVSAPTRFTRSDSVFETGPASGRIQGVSDGHVTVWQRPQQISSGTEYRVSAWIRVDTVDDPFFRVVFQVRWFDMANHQIIQTDTIASITSGTDEFSHQEALLTAPPGATAATTRFLTIDLNGSVFVDTILFQTVQ